MRGALSALCALMVGGCSLPIPPGFFACATDEDCRGSGMMCIEGRCGPRSDGAMDARVPPDGQVVRDAGDGGPTCTGDAQCDDGVVCTLDRCVDGECVHDPEDTVCTAGPDGVCDPVSDCQYSLCDETTCVAGLCETASCDGSTCVRTPLCAAGQSCCEGACAALAEDTQHCGTCGNRCEAVNGAPSCVSGNCRAVCSGGFADCDTDPTTCETAINTAMNCGGCGVTCTGGTPVCVASGGSFACESGCPTGQTLCGTSCVDPLTSFPHCGTCGMACDATRSDRCMNGNCRCGSGPTCSGSQVCCGGTCVSLGTTTNCSSCGHSCSTGQGCCGGSCVSLSSTTNCGACGNNCSSGQTCYAMSCCTPDCSGCRTSSTSDGCGGTCAANCNASTQYCSGTSCRNKVANGQSCTSNIECTSGNCVMGRCCASACSGGTPVCNASGSACVCTSTSCSSSQYCDGTACRPKLAVGATCTEAIQCSSGYCSTFYVDADGDGYGGNPATVCATSTNGPPSGYVERGGDCADSDASRNPGAIERCDAVDYDCNGSPRNGCPSTDETITSPTSGSHCGPGTNGTSVGSIDACPTGMVIAGYDIYYDTLVQGLRAACVPVRIQETPGTPESSYRLVWDSTTFSFTT